LPPCLTKHHTMSIPCLNTMPWWHMGEWRYSSTCLWPWY